MKSLDRKLLRDLKAMWAQAITIALVVGAGITAFVSMQSTWRSLRESRDVYYERRRFGDVFVRLERAPSSVADRLRSIPGVARVHPRIVEIVRIPIEGLIEPAIGQIVSLPDHGEPPLNGLHISAGRNLSSADRDQVLIGAAFAEKHDLKPGDTITAILNGTLEELVIAGIAASPEFVYSIAPGSIIGDDRRFTPLWMLRSTLGPAFRMEGAFNDAVIALEPDANVEAVIEAVDRVLERYGGLGAYGRRDHPSDAMLRGELQQVERLVVFVPLIFLGVAAFLLNVVLSRLILLERPQIATLKAIGYSDLAIGLHYVKLVAVVVSLGALLGIGLGTWLGRELTALYSEFFRLPLLVSRVDTGTALTAVFASLAAAVIGALTSVRRIARLSPAEAMRPAAPAIYRRSFLDRPWLRTVLSPAARMVIREMMRRPLRTLVSSLGIAMAVGILVLGRFGSDAWDPVLDLVFSAQQREDATVTFDDPMPERSLHSLASIPGVVLAEGIRTVPVRMRHLHHERDVSLIGMERDGELRGLFDTRFERVALPKQGLLISRILAEVLEVEPGDTIEIEVREGDRRKLRVPLTATIDDAFGMQAYLSKPELHRLLGEAPTISSALLAIDSARDRSVQERLLEIPRVVSVIRKSTVLSLFEEQSKRTMLVMTLIMTIFAATIAVGVVYNNARVALSMRERDLASLRVLGFTKHEIAIILLGEQAFQVLLGIPLGLWLGTLAARALIENQLDPESWRLPVMISSETYAFAVVVVLTTAIASGLLVRRRLDRLDLIGVLKTRE